MRTAAKVSHGLGRLLESGGRGVWCDTELREHAIYFFLFGPWAELTAWLLPSRDELAEAAPGKRRRPIFIIITDQMPIARLAEARGHFAIYYNLGVLSPRTTTLWLKNMLRVQFGQIRPETVFFSPYFFTRLPRPRHLALALAELLRRFSRDRRPHMIVNELENDFKYPLIGFYELWKAGGQAEPAAVHYFGDPAYIDVSSLFADKDYIAVEALGWRTARPLRQMPRPGLFYLWLSDPLVRREVQLALSGSLSQENGRGAHGPEIVTPETAGVGLAGMLEQIARAPGVVLADTSAPLLPLLSVNAPVVLLRGPSMNSQMGLVKYSFFAGAGPERARWPVLAGSHQINGQFADENFGAWWKPWGERRSALEAKTSQDCATQFIERIYKPMMSKAV